MFPNARSDTSINQSIARIIAIPHIVNWLHHINMTINEYISQKFQSFGINLSEADLLDMCLNAEISGEDEMNEYCYGRVFVAIAVSRCLGTFKVSRTTIHSCARSTD